MKTKQEIVDNWLQRYTKMPLDKFGEHILLTNFNNYVDIKGKDEKKRRRRITNRKYYLKRKGIKNIEQFNKDMFGDLKEGE